MKKTRKKTKINTDFIIYTGVLLSFSIINITLIINLIKLKDIETTIRLIVISILITTNLLFIFKYYIDIFKKKKKKKINITAIIMIILSLVIGFINYNINKIYGVIYNITENYTEYKLTIVTLSSNTIDNIKDIDKDIAVIQDENITNGYNFAKEILEKNNIKQELIKYESYLDIVKDLYSEEITYAFLPDNYASMFSQDEEFKDIGTKLKVIHDEVKKVEITPVSKDVNKPFSILLMGVDTLNSSYNADTLLLVTFNPNTLKMTMLSIPRDTYTKIACSGGKHKINSSGWYSDKCVVDTVSNLVDIDIDYYAKINFVGIVDLVDALGGIEVDVVYPFCEQNSRREFGSSMIYVEEGLQTLNGEQALALSRNRHFWPGLCPSKYNEKGYYDNNLRNDITRGLNQQLVIKGILNSLTKVKDLNTIYSLLDTIGNNVSTNMDKDTILSFYNVFKNIISTSNLKDIESMFDIDKLGIEVYGTYINISGLNLSMIIPHKNSINAVSNAMKENLELKEKELIKTFSFDINNPYEEETIGKGIYGGTTLSLLEDLTGKTYDYAKNYCDQNNLNCEFNYVEKDSNEYQNNQVISQSIPGNYDKSLIGNKTITIEVAKVTTTNDKNSFDYSKCSTKEYKDNKKCQVPNFTNKTLEEFNSWYKNFTYIKVKRTEKEDTTKDNNLITKQSVSNTSIYEIFSNDTTIEIEYIKNSTTENDSEDKDKTENNNETEKPENNKPPEDNNQNENNNQTEEPDNNEEKTETED